MSKSYKLKNGFIDSTGIVHKKEKLSEVLEKKFDKSNVIQENGTVSTSNVYSSKAIQNILDKIHPVGTIKMTTVNTNPGTYLPGTWVAWGSGRVPVGVDTSQSEFNEVEKTGGEKTHQLTVAEMPSHHHWSSDDAVGLFQGWGDKSADGWVNAAREGTGGNWGTGYAGGDQSHNNLQPYITCYMWKRTA